MKINRILVTLSAAAVFLSAVLTGIAYSQAPSDENKTVIEIAVKNNRAISTETILSKIKTKVGDKLSQETLNDDLKRLYATQYFTDVSIDVEDKTGGVLITFVVEEKSVVDDIIFTGNTAFRAQKLKSMMKTKPNEMLNLSVLAQDIAEIKAAYVKKGYPLVDVKYGVDLDKENNKSKIMITVDEKTRVKVKSIAISGNKAIKTNDIRKVLATKPAWWFINPGVFKEDVFEEDLEKVKALYDDIGYLDTEVTPDLKYSEGGQVLDIVLQINEGKQYLVGNVAVNGNLVLPEKDVLSKIKMKSKKPFSTRGLRDDVVALKQYYYTYGYMNVTIEVERNLNPATGYIDVSYNIDGKEIVYIGKIEIKGNTKTRDIVIRRELRVYPGERFNGEKIKRSKERIYNLGFFENVSFDAEPTDTPNVQNVIVSVKETKTGEFSFGGGYSSIDMLVGFVEISQRNFDIMNFPTFTGGGQNLTIKAEIGMVRNNFNVGWTDPWIFGYPYAFGFDVYRASHNRTGDLGWAYDEVRTGGDVRLGKEFNEYLRGNLIYRLEEVKIDNIIENASQDFKNEQGTNWISSLLLDLTMDTRDNVFTPSKGVVLNGSIEDAGGVFGGDKDFVRGTFSASYYHTFFEKLLLEVKGRAGIADPYGDSKELPIYERFYAGGANTIRGYKERRVGPRDSGSGDPIGGEAILVGNVELTFPVYEKILKGAVFYDVGNVWRRSEQFMAGGYKSGAGVGVRVNTPLGPVRVDYGYPLVKNHDDDRTGEFYFSMSRGF